LFEIINFNSGVKVCKKHEFYQALPLQNLILPLKTGVNDFLLGSTSHKYQSLQNSANGSRIILCDKETLFKIDNRPMLEPYSKEIEAQMQELYSRLPEKSRRLYAGVEALKFRLTT